MWGQRMENYGQIPSWVDLSPYMMYNVEALKAIGLTEETVPKTWSEFKDAAVKFKEAGYCLLFNSNEYG